MIGDEIISLTGWSYGVCDENFRLNGRKGITIKYENFINDIASKQYYDANHVIE